LAPLGLTEFARSSISVALEQHFDLAVLANEIESLRSSLLASLRRVLLAREVALADLDQARAAGETAGTWQLMGELVLAYGGSIQEGQKSLQAWDYEGAEITIALDPELGFKDNAQRLFDRAKKAKTRMAMVQDQVERLRADKSLLNVTIARIEAEQRLDRLRELQDEAKAHKWLQKQPLQAAKKEDRPYEGHRIRELLGPQGLTVLYGENAESNDFLTLRVAKPNDYWLHVRGNVSAHVVIVTQNHPEKVSREAILFAAKVAVLNSPTKHSGYVSVDYTLKKYVRKPRGAAKGAASYTNEKTVHVEGDR
jgi:predicted ribosome quality control (RQC) complex YloA/Tae2 family protein